MQRDVLSQDEKKVYSSLSVKCEYSSEFLTVNILSLSVVICVSFCVCELKKWKGKQLAFPLYEEKIKTLTEIQRVHGRAEELLELSAAHPYGACGSTVGVQPLTFGEPALRPLVFVFTFKSAMSR